MTDIAYGPAPADAIEEAPVPVSEDATAEPVKKRRGRPPRDPNAPKRTYTRRNTKSKRSLEDGIGGMLWMANLVFGVMPEPWNGDAFTPEEIEALAKALNNYAQDHATAYRYLSLLTAGGGSSTIQLAIVIGQITLKRLDNHGITVTQLLGMTSRKEEVSEYGSQEYDREPVPTV